MCRSLLALASVLVADSTALHAVPFAPYSYVGQPDSPSTITFNGATGTGITAYFYSVSASDTDTISIFDATTGTFLSPQGVFNNQAPITVGSSVTLHQPKLHNGDTLVFDLYNTSFPGDVFSSDPATSPDGDSHAYFTAFSGTIGAYPTINGTYVGMEEMPNLSRTGTITTTPSSSPVSMQPPLHLRHARHRTRRRFRCASSQVCPVIVFGHAEGRWLPVASFGNSGWLLQSSPPLLPSLLSTPAAFTLRENTDSPQRISRAISVSVFRTF